MTALGWLETRPDITSLRAAVCDLNGILRVKRVPASQAGKVLEGRCACPSRSPASTSGARTSRATRWSSSRAMDAFGASEAIGPVFAPILLDTFLGMKKQELPVFSQQISPFEHETYLEIV